MGAADRDRRNQPGRAAQPGRGRPGPGNAPAPPGRGRPGPGQRSSDRGVQAGPARKERQGSGGQAAAGYDDDDDWGLVPGERDSLVDVPGGVRLQKVLAAAGVGSRRSCEELIAEGRVEVDGEVVRRFGARVDPKTQVIRVDGKRIPASEDLVYLALNKPPGVVSTMSDDRGRRTIADLVADRSERLFYVGRLDYDTEGLILLTNDGELAHRLAHPRYGVLKTYLAEVPGPLPRDLARRMTTGIELEDGTVIADRFRVVEQAGSRVLVEVTLHEGRKHVVRRMLAKVGHPVSRLVRTQVGPVSLGSLRPAATRRLTTAEVGNLYAAVGM
ncbi:MAG TPA: pseudouridine synthase [Streptosporangiaceae bacterium]|nr:pseudouridine synthase [Streptosporangiaceae bacterium]